MMLRGRSARPAARIEQGLDRAVSPLLGRNGEPPVIDPYLGYSEPDALIVRGRVLSALRRAEPRADQGWFTNLRQMLALFLTDEVAGVTVRARGREAVTDAEGYFTLRLPRRGDSGWVEVEAGLVSQPGGQTLSPAVLPVQVTRGDARFGVISDIDDTVMRTGAYSLLRNLWTSLTGNALTRHIFPDAVDLMDRLSADGRNPVFYVSSSPWNMHEFLARVFDRNGLVRGPIFLRDLGIGKRRPGARTHGDHKGEAIDCILAANPHLPFVLVGDTGQHDAMAYEAAALRHPGRVARVILRTHGRGADRADLAHAEGLRGMGVPVHVAPNYAAALTALSAGSTLCDETDRRR